MQVYVKRSCIKLKCTVFTHHFYKWLSRHYADPVQMQSFLFDFCSIFSGPCFLHLNWAWRFTLQISVFNTENMDQKTPYLDNFHAVHLTHKFPYSAGIWGNTEQKNFVFKLIYTLGLNPDKRSSSKILKSIFLLFGLFFSAIEKNGRNLCILFF